MNIGVWGRDVQSSTSAVRATQDGSILTSMANDLISGRVRPCIEILRAFAERRDLPLDAAYRLAKAFPKCHRLASRLCSRRDAAPDMLDEWAEDPGVRYELATNPSTRQRTIDRLSQAMNATDIGYLDVINRVSMPLLESLVSADASFAVKYFASSRTAKPELLRMLAFDPVNAVRRNVVRNPYTEPAIVSEMANQDEDIHVLVSAAERSTDERVLDRLADRLCELKVQALREAILRNRHASDAARTVASMITVD